MLEIYNSFEQVGLADRGLVWNSDSVEALELDNLRSQAVATINSALNRKGTFISTLKTTFLPVKL